MWSFQNYWHTVFCCGFLVIKCNVNVNVIYENSLPKVDHLNIYVFKWFNCSPLTFLKIEGIVSVFTYKFSLMLLHLLCLNWSTARPRVRGRFHLTEAVARPLGRRRERKRRRTFALFYPRLKISNFRLGGNWLGKQMVACRSCFWVDASPSWGQ